MITHKDFGISLDEAQAMRRNYLKSVYTRKYIKERLDEIDNIIIMYQRHVRVVGYGLFYVEKFEQEAEMLKKKKQYLYGKIKKNSQGKPIKTTYYDVDEIKKTPILNVFRESGIELKSYGSNRWKCKCPFHNEKTASLTVYEDKNDWYCFGCGKGGNVINFIMLITPCDFKEACKILSV